MVQFGEGLWWGVSRCGFSWGSLQFFLGHFHENLNIRILSSSPVDCHPFWADWVKGGSVEMFKSQRHTRSGAGRGVSQANGAAIHSKLPGLCQHEIVSRIAKKWKQCGLCKPVMGAWWVMCEWATVSQVLPHNSATLSFRFWSELRNQQIGTPFDWVRTLEGGFGGGGGALRGVHSTKIKKTPSAAVMNFIFRWGHGPIAVVFWTKPLKWLQCKVG